ncbi:YafY family protein [Blastococcus sp. URHD0036]|uniref:helix-turn-helix transcriptional regulator n=1 Tax=Blastococcus sp. URHD0036 TaxID=1380356 RepID=UPI000495ABFA|nr:WYL domain-containing protein [Blastococcus sp. URHD0036]
MRADRLIATLLLLQARGRVTAAQVARELEVSVRTARRDLEALALSGVPVYSVAGRGGGWALVGGARTDLSGLTAGEARALFLAAGPAGAALPAVQGALRKLAQALPAPLREPARTAATAVVVDAAGWDREAPPAPEHLSALERAVVEGERVRLDYAGRGSDPSSREVDPLGLVSKSGVWYLVAGTAAGVRTFRVDRVRTVEGTGEAVERPADFDLAAAWAASAAAVAGRRGGVRVRARAEPGVLGRLRVRFGTRLTVGDAGADGRVEVELAGPAVEFVAAEVAGFGRQVEVLDPPEARDRLAGLGRELAEVYAAPAVE